MNRSVIAVIGAILTAAGLIFAQNARVTSMGGCGIIADPNLITSNPAIMNAYPDLIQATGTAAAFGPFIAVKGLGDVLNIGVLGNSGPVLRSDFYADAVVAVNGGTPNAADLSDPLPPIPHFLLGLNLDAFKLGADIFCEIARTKFFSETTGSGAGEIKDKGVIYNFGGIVSAKLDIGDMYLSPLVAAGLPRIKQKDETPSATGTTTTEVKSHKGMFVKGGVELGIPLLDLNWVTGGFFTYEGYQFESIAGGNTVEGLEYPAFIFDGYIGFTTEILSDLFVVSQYGLSIASIGEKDDDADPAATVTEETWDRIVGISHIIAGGMERPIGDVWIFDELTPRAGVRVGLGETRVKTSSDISGTASSENTTRSSSQIAVSSVAPTVGLGLSKGVFSFDIVSNLAAWAGIVSGPPVVMGTITFNFGGESSSSGSSSPLLDTPASEPSSTPDNLQF